jgi:hypothetical protein
MDAQIENPVPEFKKFIVDFCRFLYKRWDVFLIIVEDTYKLFYKSLQLKEKEITNIIQIFSWYGIFINKNDINLYLNYKKNNPNIINIKKTRKW